MPDPINQTLIARAQAGNAAAIGAIYEHYQNSIFRYLFYRVGNHHLAEDLTAEVFLKMIQALPGYRSQRAPFQAWIFQIARNISVDHFRRMKVRDHVGLNENMVSSGEGPETATERNLMSHHLAGALDTLTDDQRDVLVMRFVAEMPIAHVASVLEKTETAVKALQRRGLQALRKVLKDRQVEDV